MGFVVFCGIRPMLARFFDFFFLFSSFFFFAASRNHAASKYPATPGPMSYSYSGAYTWEEELAEAHTRVQRDYALLSNDVRM